MLTSSDIGKAGELRVASELLLLGYHPMLSIVDNGIDITLTTGLTIQVKACHSVTMKNGDIEYYVFTFHTLQEKRDADGRRKKKQKLVADFAVLWCIGHEAFFVIPREEIGSRHTINIRAYDMNVERKCMWDRFRSRWSLLGGV